MSALLSAIRSKSSSHDADYGLRFKRLDSITKRTTVDPAPDLHDGSRPWSLHKSVQQHLGPVITSTRHFNALVLPNFFLEVKAPEGCFEVVKRQACLDGAVGARAMHALQNYGAEKPVYDGNAYSFSFVYHAGTATLHVYAHYPTASLEEGGAPEYHMKQIDAFFMAKNHHGFVAGVTAFRNARDMAKKYRIRFIEAANARAEGKSQPLAEVVESAVAVVAEGAAVAVCAVDDVGLLKNAVSLNIVGPVEVYPAEPADHLDASHADSMNGHHPLSQADTVNEAHTV